MSTERNTYQSGQIGIIIILIMVVLLTIGLSLAARSSREVTLSTQEEESTRTFNAAEAGVEQALSNDFSFAPNQYHPTPTTIPGSNATVDYTITKVNVLETRLFQGVSAHVQLTDSSGAQTVNNVVIDWSKENNCATQKPAALVVSIYSVDTTTVPETVNVRHQAFAACDYGDSVPVSPTAGASPYFKEVTIPLQAKDTFMRVKAVYNDTTIKVTGTGKTGVLPVQYYSIYSTAKNQSGSENRSVQVNRTLSVEPSILDYVLFSGTTIIK